MHQSRIAIAVASLFFPCSLVIANDATNQLPEVRVTSNQGVPGSPNDSVVTGSKTDTPLRDLPASVVVVPEATLREQAVYDMNRALENASGVQPQMAGGYGFANNYSIRGLPMRFLRDGYFDGTSQNGYWRTLYDVERIEVLKGPGSALYGSGQPGGTVNLVTKAPRSGFGAELGAMVGSFNTRSAYADVYGSLGKNIAGRVIADVEKSDGFRGLSRDIKEISPSIIWQIGDDKALTVDFDHRDLKIKPDNYGIVFDARGQIANVPAETRYYSPMNDTRQKIDRVTLAHDWAINGNLNMHTALVHDRRELDMVRNAGANGGNAAGQITGRTIRTQDDDARFTLLQNEFVWKVKQGNIGHTILAGAEYMNTDATSVRVGYNLPNITNIYAPVVPETSLAGLSPVASQGFNRKITSNNFGVYLQDQISLGEQFKVRAGLRNDRVHADDVGSQGAVASRSIVVRDNILSGSLGTVWQPSRTLSFYTGVSKGGFVNLATEAAAISPRPEESTQIEAGVKATVLDGLADINLAAFQTKRDNYFITLPGALDPTPDGKDKTRGLELDMITRPMSGLSVQFSGVIQNPETLSNTLASNTILGVNNRSIAGKMPTGVAKRSARLWGTYEFQQEALRGWGVGAGATYKSESYADSLNLYRVPSYTVLDAAVFYKAKTWDATLKLNNLANKQYYTSPTFVGALPGETRNAMLTARYRF